MQGDFLIDLEYTVIVVKDMNDKVKLNQIHKLAQSGATTPVKLRSCSSLVQADLVRRETQQSTMVLSLKPIESVRQLDA